MGPPHRVPRSSRSSCLCRRSSAVPGVMSASSHRSARHAASCLSFPLSAVILQNTAGSDGPRPSPVWRHPGAGPQGHLGLDEA